MTLLNQTKLLVASAAILAILSCSIDGFTPLLSLRPNLQTAFPTSTELDARKKKTKSGQGFGAGVAQLDKPKTISEMTKIELKDECRNRGLKVSGNKAVLIERLLNTKVVKEEVAAEAISPISTEELEKLAELKKAAEIFQRSLKAQQFKYDAKAAVAEPESELGQRIQPLTAEQETSVASKYAAIADVGERAFEILSDLGFFNRED